MGTMEFGSYLLLFYVRFGDPGQSPVYYLVYSFSCLVGGLTPPPLPGVGGGEVCLVDGWLKQPHLA